MAALACLDVCADELARPVCLAEVGFVLWVKPGIFLTVYIVPGLQTPIDQTVD